jgi:hypothetical protein
MATESPPRASSGTRIVRLPPTVRHRARPTLESSARVARCSRSDPGANADASKRDPQRDPLHEGPGKRQASEERPGPAQPSRRAGLARGEQEGGRAGFGPGGARARRAPEEASPASARRGARSPSSRPRRPGRAALGGPRRPGAALGRARRTTRTARGRSGHTARTARGRSGHTTRLTPRSWSAAMMAGRRLIRLPHREESPLLIRPSDELHTERHPL